MPAQYQYIQQLKEKLAELDPYMVLLFGSYANGTSDKDSDIDLLVVTNDNFMPQSFKEKHEIYKLVSQKIRSVKCQISVDLIVHTKPMYQSFIKQNSSFAREIITRGKVIYEGNHKRMA